MKKKLFILSLVILLAGLMVMVQKTSSLSSKLAVYEEKEQLNKEMVVEMITNLDYHDEVVYVIGHYSPDADTVGAAVGMAYLLNSLGIEAKPAITEPVNLETEFAYTKYGYEIPEVLADATGKQLWLVDHSAYSQMVNGAKEARIVGVCDHHGIGDVENVETICVLSAPTGSSCSLIKALCDLCDIELPADVAGPLLVGVVSDTSNKKSSSTRKLDEEAMEKLKIAAGISDIDELYAGMSEARLSYKGLSDQEIFYSDYKNYEEGDYHFGIANVKVARADQVKAMAERMQQVINEEVAAGNDCDLLLFEIYDMDYSLGYMGFGGKDSAFATEAMEEVFGSLGEKDDNYYVFSPSLNRKTEIVPAINEYLTNLK